MAFLGRGFSLIELLVVIALIGILAGISYPSYERQVARSTMTEGRIYLESLAVQQAQSRLQAGKFLLLDALLQATPPSERISAAFDVSQKLSGDFLGFQLLLAPKGGKTSLEAMTLDHWGLFHSDYEW